MKSWIKKNIYPGQFIKNWKIDYYLKKEREISSLPKKVIYHFSVFRGKSISRPSDVHVDGI